MRSIVLIFLFLVISLSGRAQNPVLAVNRVDKFTKELIKQTSLYSFKEGDIVKLHFNVRSVDENYFLQLNVQQPVTVKKGTEIILTMEDGKQLKLISDNDIISLSESDVSKRMIVCPLDFAEITALMKLQVNAIRVPTSNKGVVNVVLAAKDKPMIRTAMALVSPKLVPKKI
ncbi:hypothetical protein [Daejeonella lutea]|uniref:Uncharacterized protein n=1 Tax=Daejeonella lutea TaxID=572036 RepID=A0A1T5CVM6_9SPHI|nr:hypothetical protein [Daejeonella lutea]SKB63427.1 hypothetical protein SAMN05661099_1921 [Daejeonella lutea]